MPRRPSPKNRVSRIRRVAGLRKTSGAVRKVQSGRKMSRGSLPSASRSEWYRIPRPPSNSIASGATAPDLNGRGPLEPRHEVQDQGLTMP